ncbi:MAG TPA: glycosyltransferase [Roseiarcus sp.]|jgi:hopene-associated glycosyltransferase HpnB|nr:glycosyltransferase [Roseiarcus sp.]
MILVAISLIPLAIWAYLLFGRGWFWLCGERDDTAAVADKARNDPDAWPSVVAIIPARDEADMIAHSVGSLLRQDYSGQFSVVVVDDQSADSTAAVASTAASEARAAERLKIVTGNGPPPGWTGKLSAMRQGLAEVEASEQAPEFVLFTDADIAYAPHVLSRLVAIARTKNSVLTSLMVKLRCESAAERWLAPAFVFFFQMLYPFAWVNDPRQRTAAAAGGCMLVRRQALHAAGGLEAVRNALIDDCALGALMKGQGQIWLGLTESVDSLRAYSTFDEFRRMVSRSAFAELHYSPLRLAGAIGGMALVYVAPLFFAIFARGAAQAVGALTWAMMAIALVPMLRLYGRSLVGGFALPAIAAAYVAFTFDSAYQYWRGRGGYWKGRFQAPMRETGRA